MPTSLVQQVLRHAGALLVVSQLSACGGGDGGGGSSKPANELTVAAPSVEGSNVLAVRVDRGVDDAAINTAFVTVTVCQPDTSQCVTVDHVLLDTGSNGLRIAASALPAGFTLPVVTTAGGAPAAECAQFVSGYSWGSVRRADVRLAGQTAVNLPIQVSGDPSSPYAATPLRCSATGSNIGAGRGAKGILGVGLFNQDCGAACESGTDPGIYYGCTALGCSPARLPVTSQVTNPVSALPAHNNGVVIKLPAVPVGGAASATGSLILGIGTAANNQLGGATVYATNAQGYFTTTYKGVSYPASFLDTGSNGYFFQDASLQSCGDFYCPSTPVTLSATNTSATGVSGVVSFTIEDASNIAPGTGAIHIGGSAGGLTRSFDWGLPFFFGRTVFVARDGVSTPYGSGPYWAY